MSMRYSLRKFFAACLVLGLTNLADGTRIWADEPGVGSVTGGGTACGGHSVQARYDASSRSIRLELPNMSAELAAGDSKALVRASCTLVIAIQAPYKKRIRISRQAVRAELSLASGSAANVSLETFLPGSSGAKLEPRIQASGQKLSGARWLEGATTVQGGCGASESLRANLSLVLTPKPLTGVSKVSLTELALSAALTDCE